MKKLTLLIFSTFIIASVGVMLTSCGEKKVDKRQEVSQLVEQGNFRIAKQKLITLRSNYPNDLTLQKLEKKVDMELAKADYKRYLKAAQEKDTWKAWIGAMIKIKKIENADKEMVSKTIKEAAEKCVDAGARQLKDEQLLGLLKKLVIRYQVITHRERLMYITMFHQEGRFPIKEWKDTFVTNYPELMDENGEKFIGYPHPTKEQLKKK